MKKLKTALLLVSVIILFSQCSQTHSPTSVILCGKIENPAGEKIVFSKADYAPGAGLDSAMLDEDGYFVVEFEIVECLPITLSHGRENSLLYACPGDSLFITLNPEEFDESIQYSGIGESKNNMLAEFYLKFEDFSNENLLSLYSVKDTSIDIYIELVEQRAAEIEVFFNQQKEKYELPDPFLTYMETKLYYHNVGNYIYPFYSYKKDTSLFYKETLDEARQVILNAGKYENPDPLSDEYQSWVKHTLGVVISYDVRNQMKDFDMHIYDSLVFSGIRKYLTNDELKEYFSSQLAGYVRSFRLDRIETLKQWVEANFPDAECQAEVNMVYDEMVASFNQPVHEDAELYNLDDEDLSHLSFDDVLNKYKGNVIYLDFWASWCGPCKAELPNSAKLSKKLENEDVVFLYVSTDKKSEDWEKIIRVMQLHGIHYRLGANTRKPVFETYGIKFIPHYVLFDKEGNMVENNFSRPGNPETEKRIRELL